MTYLFIIVNISSGKILEINLAIIAGLINFIRILHFSMRYRNMIQKLGRNLLHYSYSLN